MMAFAYCSTYYLFYTPSSPLSSPLTSSSETGIIFSPTLPVFQPFLEDGKRKDVHYLAEHVVTAVCYHAHVDHHAGCFRQYLQIGNSHTQFR
jgi:hypothetical protein